MLPDDEFVEYVQIDLIFGILAFRLACIVF